MTAPTSTTTLVPATDPAPAPPDTVSAWSTDTPVGELTLLLAGGAVVAAGFCPPSTLWARLPERRRAGDAPVPVERAGAIGRAVLRYLDGDLDALDAIPVDQDGTELQRRVWDGLRAVPAGSTSTYAELASVAGRPAAARAAGSACGRNLVAPIVPCHRAVRSDGSLGGYEYGLEIKRWLLDHEAAAGA